MVAFTSDEVTTASRVTPYGAPHLDLFWTLERRREGQERSSAVSSTARTTMAELGAA
jgi:hypothetical protein